MGNRACIVFYDRTPTCPQGVARCQTPQRIRPLHWADEYSPYTVQRGDDAGTELPAFEVLDADAKQALRHQRGHAFEVQEANARLAVICPWNCLAILGSLCYRCSPITTSTMERKAKRTGTRSPSSPPRRQERRNYE